MATTLQDENVIPQERPVKQLARGPYYVKPRFLEVKDLISKNKGSFALSRSTKTRNSYRTSTMIIKSKGFKRMRAQQLLLRLSTAKNFFGMQKTIFNENLMELSSKSGNLFLHNWLLYSKMPPLIALLALKLT